MADLYSVTAPLLLRRRNGDSLPVLRAYPHSAGVVMLGLYDANQDPADALFLIKGELQGSGPWKIGNYIISVLGCHNTDAVPAEQYAAWKFGVESGEVSLPDPEKLQALIRQRFPL